MQHQPVRIQSQQLINEYFEIRHHRTHSMSGKKFSALNFILNGHANATWSGVIGTVLINILKEAS